MLRLNEETREVK